LPGDADIFYSPHSAPQSFQSGFTIAFAAQKTAKLCNHPDGVMEIGGLMRNRCMVVNNLL
jgi:hypothetical protein